jgi:hypothetical protein
MSNERASRDEFLIAAEHIRTQSKSFPNSSSMPTQGSATCLASIILDGRWCGTLDLTMSSPGFIAT